ncbi:MAG: Unknown protein [uncultured Thiotrichaceae bacterium]|uniref:Ribbon-helix-helix protein CopG domain-containing protein n=1 Tax=uncultured Thiotrichaceae bacterium TaxID=298394 RepID=A0A6S6U7J5_9GAMM|nr:MAG: Unknown protein [uncultured Thiotrichaceae bacterium]
METRKLTVRLPQDDLKFLKQFAIDHKLTVTELIHRQLSHLRQQSKTEISPLLKQMTGILPKDINVAKASEEYHHYLLDKHQ